MTSKPRSKDSEQSDAILYYFVKTEENQGSFCVLGIFRLTCFISYTSLYHLYITSIYHVRPCHGLLRFDPMWRGLLWGWSTTEFAQALQLFTFSTMAAWQTHSQKTVIHRHSIHNMFFFLAAGFLVEDPGVFFGHPEFQVVFPYKICRIWGQKVWWMVWTKPSPGLILFWWPPFLDANKKGPKVGQRLWLYHKSYPEMWIFCTLKSITYKMTTMLRVESQPF